MTMVDLSQAQYGDRVQHDLLVLKREERQKASGEPFVRLTLGNSSGSIDTEPIWQNLLDSGWADGAVPGAIVQAIGHVSSFDSKRQLKLTAPLRVLPKEEARLEDFLPRIAQDPTALWDHLDKLRRDIESERLRKVLALFFDDEPFRLDFERTPASINGHHGKIGGLLLHVWEVAYIGRHMAKAMRANADLVVAGALLHDIGKVEAYGVSWEGFARTPCGHLIEHVVLGCLMLERRLAAVGEPLCSDDQLLELQHLILSHHGKLEFGSPVRPLTAEAEILHRADEASAKSADVIESLDDGGAFRDGIPFADRSKLWRVEKRSLWRKGHEW
jgi:3'-5' exoribonuclease